MSFDNFRYKVLATKYTYYIGLLVGLVPCTVLSVFINFIYEGDIGTLIVVLFFDAIFMYVLYSIAFRSIYASIDFKNRTLIYGNLFFSQEVDVKLVQVIKRKWHRDSSFKIMVNGEKSYLLNIAGTSVKGYSELLSILSSVVLVQKS